MKKHIFAFFAALAFFLSVVPAVCQNPVTPFRTPRVNFLTATGQPLSGGCIFTYQAGTTTPQATYTDYTGSVSNTNPVILDVTGSAVIWLGTNSYKFVAYSAGGYHCASGSLQWTTDQVPGDAFLNGPISGATITNPTIASGTDSGTAISNAVITASNINGTPIGGTAPAAGAFTNLSVAMAAMSFTSTPVFPAGSYGYFTMTLTNNVTSSSITGGTNGQLITFDLCQNGSGGFTFAWPTNYTNPPVVSVAANACTIATAFYNGGFWTTVSTSQQLLIGAYDALAFSATPVFPAGSFTSFAMTLTGNVTSSTITGGVTGELATISLCQDGAGSHTVVWPVNLLYAPTISPAANGCTGIVAVNNGTNWVTVSISLSSPTLPSYGRTIGAAPVGPASTSTFTMQGLGTTITPTTTGRVTFTASGLILTTITTVSSGIYCFFYYGTGTAPLNGASLTGSSLGGNLIYSIPTAPGSASNIQVPFSRTFIVTGLTVGTPYWLDAACEAQVAAGASLNYVYTAAQEF